MPKGIFVQLFDRERARLRGIIDFLRANLSGSSKERREYQRYPLFADAEYATAQGIFSSEIRNISLGGVYLRCMGPLLSMGARFPVTIYLGGSTSKGIVLQARVAWVDMFDEDKGMGVLFDEGQSELRAINRSIKRIKSHLATLAK